MVIPLADSYCRVRESSDGLVGANPIPLPCGLFRKVTPGFGQRLTLLFLKWIFGFPIDQVSCLLELWCRLIFPGKRRAEMPIATNLGSGATLNLIDRLFGGGVVLWLWQGAIELV